MKFGFGILASAGCMTSLYYNLHEKEKVYNAEKNHQENDFFHEGYDIKFSNMGKLSKSQLAKIFPLFKSRADHVKELMNTSNTYDVVVIEEDVMELEYFWKLHQED